MQPPEIRLLTEAAGKEYIDDTVGTEVVEVVAESGTVIAAAESAVVAAMAGKNVLEKATGDNPSVLVAITDEDGRRTFLESGFDGKPTDHSASLVVDKIAPAVTLKAGIDHTTDYEGVLVSITDEDGRRTDLEVAKDGHFPQRVVDNIGSRITDLSAGLKTSVAAQAADLIGENGVVPTDTGYDVILLAGQSNMSGRGTPYDQRLDPPHSRIWQWGSSGTYAGVKSQAIEPLAMVDTPSGIGPGLVFGRYYAGITAPNRQVVLVAAAQGGQAVVGGSWDPNPNGSNTNNALTRTNAAIAALGANARLVAILWVQGETDGDNLRTGAEYQAKLDELFLKFRAQITGAANVPIVLGGMVPEYLTTGTRTQIAAVHADTPHRLPYTAYAPGIPSANLGDGNHYAAAGSRKLGRAMFEQYLVARDRTTTI